MNTEKIFELLNGKALSIIENQPCEVMECHNKLDIAVELLKKTLTNSQLLLLDEVMDRYTELITLSDNFHFECGIKIGEKIYRILSE